MNPLDLSQPALNWAVAKVLQLEDVSIHTTKNGQPGLWVVGYFPDRGHVELRYADDWAQGGPVVDQWWSAICKQSAAYAAGGATTGRTPLLEHFMRCLVAGVLGDTFEIPEVLL